MPTYILFKAPILYDHICYLCENLMIASPALVLKDAFEPQFANIEAILDPGVILAKSSSYCLYVLSLSYFF